MKTQIPLPTIQITGANYVIDEFNRFYLPWIEIDPNVTFEQFMDNARYTRTTRASLRFEFSPNVQSHPGFRRFALFHFNKECITRDEVLISFKRAQIREATLEEMLAVTNQYLSSRRETNVIALGSSNIRSARLSREAQPWLYQWMTSKRRHLEWQRSVEAFPSMDWHNDVSYLHSTKGAGGWKSNCVFLGVVENREFDFKLLDMPITESEYLSLPHSDILPNDFMSTAIGTMCVHSDGTIRKLVYGCDMEDRQFGAGISGGVPERGFIHYRPIFV